MAIPPYCDEFHFRRYSRLESVRLAAQHTQENTADKIAYGSSTPMYFFATNIFVT